MPADRPAAGTLRHLAVWQEAYQFVPAVYALAARQMMR